MRQGRGSSLDFKGAQLEIIHSADPTTMGIRFFIEISKEFEEEARWLRGRRSGGQAQCRPATPTLVGQTRCWFYPSRCMINSFSIVFYLDSVEI